MSREFLSRFILGKQKERLFFQTHEEFVPNEVIVQGYVSGKTLQPMVDAQIGSLKSGAARQTSFLVDTGSFAIVLSPEDGAHLLTGETSVKRRSIALIDGSTKASCSFVNTEVWLSCKHSDQDMLLAIRLPVYVLDHTLSNMSSVLGRDVLGRFKRIEIVLAEGKVIFQAGGSRKMKAYRKI